MSTAHLAMAALSCMASLGDTFSDAPECAHSVAAAQNLTVLASRLTDNKLFTVGGMLYADGHSVCAATAYVDGSLSVEIPADFDTSGHRWEMHIHGIAPLRVTMFVTGDASDDEHWVIDDAAAFYNHLLH